MNSVSEFTGSEEFTTITIGAKAVSATGTNAVLGSYGKLFCRKMFIVIGGTTVGMGEAVVFRETGAEAEVDDFDEGGLAEAVA